MMIAMMIDSTMMTSTTNYFVMTNGLMENLRKRRIKTNKQKARLMHIYYARTGFYLFVWKNLKKAILPITGIVLAIFLFNKYVYNINDGLHHLIILHYAP